MNSQFKSCTQRQTRVKKKKKKPQDFIHESIALIHFD